jgi:hypothetical protein
MSRWNTSHTWIVLLLGAIILALASVEVISNILPRLGYDPTIQESGEGFTVGNMAVMATFGYSNDGDRLRYLIILTWPITTPPDARLPDSRYDANSGMLPRVRHLDGKMRQVGTDGHVYMFIGDELRTMRVAMNEHTDTIGLTKARSLDHMWQYLQQFRVGD